jgi:hypothetical protein
VSLFSLPKLSAVVDELSPGTLGRDERVQELVVHDERDDPLRHSSLIQNGVDPDEVLGAVVAPQAQAASGGAPLARGPGDDGCLSGLKLALEVRGDHLCCEFWELVVVPRVSRVRR